MRIVQFLISGIITLFLKVSNIFLNLCVMFSTFTAVYSYFTQDYRPLYNGMFGIVLGSFVMGVTKAFNDKVFYEYVSVIFDEDKTDNAFYWKYKRTFEDYSYDRTEEINLNVKSDKEYIEHLKRLGITDDMELSVKTAKSSFKEQAKKLHPDLNKDRDTTKDMQNLNGSFAYVIDNLEHIKKKRGK